MTAQSEQSLHAAIEELRRLNAERDNWLKVNREWEVAYKTLEAEHNLLKTLYADMKVESDKYKGYAVELRTRLHDVSAVITKAMMDARGKGLFDTQLKADRVEGKIEHIPTFLKQGPDMTDSRMLLDSIPKTNQQ